MPEYLAPGVYVEEVSYSAPTIEGVGTTTTAFAGPTLTGPIGGVPYGGLPATGLGTAGAPSGGIPQLLTSFGDFQNIYGGFDNLNLTLPSASTAKAVNYMAMAVKAFYDNGGSRLYVSRVYAHGAGKDAVAGNPGSPATPLVPGQNGQPDTPAVPAVPATPAIPKTDRDPGIASSGATAAGAVVAAARFPGAMLNGDAVTVAPVATKVVNTKNLPPGSLLGVASATQVFYTNGAGSNFMSLEATPKALPAAQSDLYLLTLQVTAPGPSGQLMVYSDIGLDPLGSNYLGVVLGANPPRPIDALQNQVWFNLGSSLNTPKALFDALFTKWNDPASAKTDAKVFTLSGGSDGAEPQAAQYTAALGFCQALEDIAIVGTPGASIYTDATGIMTGALIPHVEAQRSYRVAILEAGLNGLDSTYLDTRAHIDSSYAALYVPWVLTPNPLAVPGTSAAAVVAVPPTGFMAGIYARNDVEKSVAKAPANEVLIGAVDLERHINFAEQAVLNPVGVNCLRYFPDRGFRVWGARTVSSNSELKYINVRRYLVYLEHSIDSGTQWAVFENNGPALWARVQDTIDSFLYNEFKSGNLLGTSPASSYFVRCDRTTMTQNDLDNGRLICQIGVALLKPAEFVVFRIGQMTASTRS